ncbi:MAG TPA: hypothetical protein VIC04_04985 [Terriglobia bacterium]
MTATSARARFVSDATPGKLRRRGLPPALAASIRALARDRRSGSAELALRACRVLERCDALRARHGAVSGNASARYDVIARAVASAQPSMASVWNVSHRWLRRLERSEAPAAAARAVARELSQAQHHAAQRAAQLISRRATVATYSASSTVFAALAEARERGRTFRVLCSEGRPMLEGRAFAVHLTQQGVPVELLTDAGLLAALPRADLVLMGCDAILPQGFVNKTGTRAILCLARELRIPCYVLADSFKFLPPAAARWFEIREEAPGEVWSIPRNPRKPRKNPQNLSVRNFYFEHVPFDGCSGIVTERGVWSPRRVVRHLRDAGDSSP